MISQDMVKLGTARSVIRDIFEFGLERSAAVGVDNVLDFSLGNPSVPAPKKVQETIKKILAEQEPKGYHSYTSAVGANDTRTAIAENLNKRYGSKFTMNNVFMTCGAAASLNITLQALVSSKEDEIIVLAPFFPEYKFFIEARGAKMVLVKPADDLTIDVTALEKAITKNTKAIIINSPNNPSGVIYPEKNIKDACAVLEKKSKEFGEPIYVISDEPYRELVYTDEKVAFIPEIYANTIICYSWSKSLSLPGERIGYIIVPSEVVNYGELYPAIAGSARILGYVCAPSLFQQVVRDCIDVEADLVVYKKNRDLLYNGLTKMGYKLAKPSGAFYLFIEAPDKDAAAFCEKAKKYDMLLVPGAGFGAPSYMRLAYCVDTEKLEKALPIFEKLMGEYK